MGYGLGVDLGTTFTAAALHDGERSEMLTLGASTQAVPSLVFVREDGDVLVGEAAERRALTEPDRLSRAAKRLLGDPTPVFLGGTPFAPATLMARLLAQVVDVATERRGAAPDRIVVTHPANWGPYKREAFDQVLAQADLAEADTLTEPEAAAIHYARSERLDPGETVAVYDLGGGTFDAAVLRRTERGFELLGEAVGVEHLGGIDFDAAVLRHVLDELDLDFDENEDDPSEVAARAQLARSCVDAKIALSVDTEAVIPVLLPGRNTNIRLTRVEFEQMIRPVLSETVRALERAVAGAGTEPDALRGVLLVGGSSRIPLIGQLIQEAMGRPVHLDADPKAAIALGAAEVAGGAWSATGAAEPVTVAAPSPPPAPPPPSSQPRVPPPPPPPSQPPPPSSQPPPAARPPADSSDAGPVAGIHRATVLRVEPDGRRVVQLPWGLKVRLGGIAAASGETVVVDVRQISPPRLRVVAEPEADWRPDHDPRTTARAAATLMDGELTVTADARSGQIRAHRVHHDVPTITAQLGTVDQPFVLGVAHDVPRRTRIELYESCRAAGIALTRISPVESLAALAAHVAGGRSGMVLGMVVGSSEGARLTPVEVGDGVAVSKGPHHPHSPTGVGDLFASFFGEEAPASMPQRQAPVAPPADVLVPVGTSAGPAADELGRRHGLGIDEPIPPDRIALVGAAIEQSVIEGHRHDALLLRDAQRTISVGTPDGRTIVLLDAAVTIPTRVGTRVDGDPNGRYVLLDEREILGPFEVDASDFTIFVDVDANDIVHLDIVDDAGRSVVRGSSDLVASLLR